jgi:hypothetical protein
MIRRKSGIEPSDRNTLRDYINDNSDTRRSGSEVDAIIKLALASATRVLTSHARKPEISLISDSAHATPAFEQRIVALFGD